MCKRWSLRKNLIGNYRRYAKLDRKGSIFLLIFWPGLEDKHILTRINCCSFVILDKYSSSIEVKWLGFICRHAKSYSYYINNGTVKHLLYWHPVSASAEQLHNTLEKFWQVFSSDQQLSQFWASLWKRRIAFMVRTWQCMPYTALNNSEKCLDNTTCERLSVEKGNIQTTNRLACWTILTLTTKLSLHGACRDIRWCTYNKNVANNTSSLVTYL